MSKVLITKQELQEQLSKPDFAYAEEDWELDDLLFGDLDLTVYELEGLKLKIQENGDIISEDIESDIKIMNQIVALDEEDHMKLYDKHGIFHDGGDDFDYGGSYVSVLLELIEQVMKTR